MSTYNKQDSHMICIHSTVHLVEHSTCLCDSMSSTRCSRSHSCALSCACSHARNPMLSYSRSYEHALATHVALEPIRMDSLTQLVWLPRGAKPLHWISGVNPHMCGSPPSSVRPCCPFTRDPHCAASRICAHDAPHDLHVVLMKAAATLLYKSSLQVVMLLYSVAQVTQSNTADVVDVVACCCCCRTQEAR